MLLIACGNVAALLLVRGLQRQQEYAVRSALGMGRVALFRQVSTESLLLAVLGGAFGVGLAFGVVQVFKPIGGHAIPRLDAVSTGWPVLAWGLGAAVLAAVLAGIFPALRASRLDPMEVLKSAGPKSSAGRGERRLLRGVTMVQTALTLALLVGAGLLIRTMMNLAQVQSGYNTGTHPDHERHRGARGLGRLSPSSPGAGSGASGCAKCRFRLGRPADRQQLARRRSKSKASPRPARRATKSALPLRSVTPGYFNLLGLPISRWARLPFHR